MNGSARNLEKGISLSLQPVDDRGRYGRHDGTARKVLGELASHRHLLHLGGGFEACLDADYPAESGVLTPPKGFTISAAAPLNVTLGEGLVSPGRGRDQVRIPAITRSNISSI